MHICHKSMSIGAIEESAGLNYKRSYLYETKRYLNNALDDMCIQYKVYLILFIIIN